MAKKDRLLKSVTLIFKLASLFVALFSFSVLFMHSTPALGGPGTIHVIPRVAFIFYGMLDSGYPPRSTASWSELFSMDAVVDVFWAVPRTRADVGLHAREAVEAHDVAALQQHFRAMGSRHVAVELCGSDLTQAAVAIAQRAGMPFLQEIPSYLTHRTISMLLSIANSAALAIVATQSGKSDSTVDSERNCTLEHAISEAYDLAIVGRFDALGFSGFMGPWCVEQLTHKRIPILRATTEDSNGFIEDRLFVMPTAMLPAFAAACAEPVSLFNTTSSKGNFNEAIVALAITRAAVAAFGAAREMVPTCVSNWENIPGPLNPQKYSPASVAQAQGVWDAVACWHALNASIEACGLQLQLTPPNSPEAKVGTC